MLLRPGPQSCGLATKVGSPCELPFEMQDCLLRLLPHGFGNLRLDGTQPEARTSLHRWEFDGGFRQLFYPLLYKHEAPELEFIPFEIFEGAGVPL